MGDSSADGLWGGVSQLATRTACLRTGLELGRFAKNSTGLTRGERFDWPREVKRIGDGFKPQLFVMSLGLNDRQSVVEKGQITMENSPAYPAKYKERVTAVLKNVDTGTSGLIWVGLAAMRGAPSDKDAREKNKYFAEAISELGADKIKYVEPWRLSETGEDKFQSYGPDANGKMLQIRSPDGEHFTSSGDLMVAIYLMPKILANLGENGERNCASTEGNAP